MFCKLLPADASSETLNWPSSDVEWMLAYCSPGYGSSGLLARARQLHPQAQLLGCTSADGIFTQEGFGPGAGLLCAERQDGIALASTLRLVGAERAAEAAASAALEVRSQLGTEPELILLHATPGFEERILEGAVSALGPRIQIFGGSAGGTLEHADWRVFCGERQAREGFVMAALSRSRPDSELSAALLGGYLPTSKEGVVTRASGRILYEIDGYPAAQVYDQWCGGRIREQARRGGNVATETSLYPVGRTIEVHRGVPYRLLAHPAEVRSDGSLVMLAEIMTGDRVEMMIGRPEPLAARAGKVVARAQRRLSRPPSGGLLLYCGGALSALPGHADAIAKSFGAAVNGSPFVGVASLGEQGAFARLRQTTNRHGNLMCVTMLFAGAE